MNEQWQALAREAGLAAEHLAIGATSLGRANYAQTAYYGQAFFALTTGMERATKLAFVIDYALEHNGSFPAHSALRRYGHDLRKLLDDADKIAERIGLDAEGRLPRTIVHEGIVKVLSDFASNITRYYNLDLVTGDPRAVQQDDPIRAWFDLVVTPILSTHYTNHQHDKHQRNARKMEDILGGYASVYHHSEQGEVINTVFEASLHTGVTEFARPFARMYVMQIARFLSRLLIELGWASYGLKTETVPDMSDFFAIFNNADNYFKRRKTWSIYRG